MPNDLIPVQFHDDTVYLIEHNGEPYVVLKPAVEALGLDWRTQQRKLMANAKRWTVVNLTIVAADGKQREMLCMPVRKWPGYMQTFELRKLPAALRPNAYSGANWTVIPEQTDHRFRAKLDTRSGPI